MAEIYEYDKEESPYWSNMFGQVPVQYDDTEEYEYVEYLESNSQGAKPALTQSRFVLYNRDIDPYLLFHKGFIQIRGYIRKAALAENAEVYYDVAEPEGRIAPCNLFNHAIWDRAELRLEGSLIQKSDNPRLIALVKHLTKYTPENEKTQGTLSFFYKDTGYGDAEYEINTASIKLKGKVDGTGYLKFTADENTEFNLLDPTKGSLKLDIGIFENKDFNKGFSDRMERCITRGFAEKRVFETYLPLSDLFSFYENYNAPFRGLKHEITLEKNQRPDTYLHRTEDTDDGIFVFEKVSMWIPRIKPSYDKLLDLDEKFVTKAQSIMSWSDYRYEYSSNISNTSLSNQMRVGSLAGRPTYCYIFFQLDAVINGDQESNKNIFSTLTSIKKIGPNPGEGEPDERPEKAVDGLAQIEMRINSHALPLQTFNLDFSDNNEDYLRAYLYLLESQGKMLSRDSDFSNPGMVVSYEEFKRLYPLFVFDFTRIEKRMYENISASELEVRWRLHGDAPGDYRCHVIIEHERIATVQGNENKLLITL
mgnify:CR=1 FL=1